MINHKGSEKMNYKPEIFKDWDHCDKGWCRNCKQTQRDKCQVQAEKEELTYQEKLNKQGVSKCPIVPHVEKRWSRPVIHRDQTANSSTNARTAIASCGGKQRQE
jgi:hypothetical protein